MAQASVGARPITVRPINYSPTEGGNGASEPIGGRSGDADAIGGSGAAERKLPLQLPLPRSALLFRAMGTGFNGARVAPCHGGELGLAAAPPLRGEGASLGDARSFGSSRDRRGVSARASNGGSGGSNGGSGGDADVDTAAGAHTAADADTAAAGEAAGASAVAVAVGGG